ncbi:transporter substrate-binding domain-containing protein [Desulfovibrio sp. JC022]|uniref:substrate-binding periplasmic protein n=1 Tax=Desulfovibrio sp. JC022 TaxID=2593642 RepID=UPI0013D79CFF
MILFDFRTQTLFLFLKEKFPSGLIWNNLDELKKYRIGVPRGYLQEQGLTVEILDNYSTGVKMLRKGYIDFMLENSVVGNYIIDMEFADYKYDIGEVWTRIEPEPMIALFSRKAGSGDYFLRKLNKGIKVIRENWTYEKILNNFHNKDFVN